jgi:O-antigen/teichoic acid export membrane protein
MEPSPSHPSAATRLKISGTAAMILGTMVSAFSVYVYQVIAGRNLGTDGFAPIGVMWTVMFLVFTVLLLPVEQYVTRHLTITGGRTAGDRTGVLLVGGTIAVGILLGVGFVLTTLDRFFEGAPVYALVMFVNLAGRSMLAVARGYLAGRRRFHAYGAAIAIEGVALVALSLFVAAVNPTTLAFAIAMSIGPIAVLLVRPFSGGHRGEPLQDATSLGIGFLGPLIIATGASQLVLSVGPIVVGFVGGTAAAISVFFITFTLFRGPVTSSYNIVARVLPDFTALAARGEQQRLSAWAGRLGLIGIGTIVLFGASGWVLGPAVVDFLYGGEFRPSSHLAALGAAGVGAALIALFLNQIYIARGETGRMALVWVSSLLMAGLVLAVTSAEPVIRVGTAFLAGEATAMVLLAIVGTVVHWRGRT